MDGGGDVPLYPTKIRGWVRPPQLFRREPVGQATHSAEPHAAYFRGVQEGNQEPPEVRG